MYRATTKVVNILAPVVELIGIEYNEEDAGPSTALAAPAINAVISVVLLAK